MGYFDGGDVGGCRARVTSFAVNVNEAYCATNDYQPFNGVVHRVGVYNRYVQLQVEDAWKMSFSMLLH
jgi:hypothetical protein